MVDFMQSYVAFFSSNWIGLAILWVLLIILARTKMECIGWTFGTISGFVLWGIFWLIV